VEGSACVSQDFQGVLGNRKVYAKRRSHISGLYGPGAHRGGCETRDHHYARTHRGWALQIALAGVPLILTTYEIRFVSVSVLHQSLVLYEMERGLTLVISRHFMKATMGNETVATLEARKKALTAAIEELQNKIDGMVTHHDDLTEVVTLEARKKALTAAIEELQNKIDGMVTNYHGLIGPVTNLAISASGSGGVDSGSGGGGGDDGGGTGGGGGGTLTNTATAPTLHTPGGGEGSGASGARGGVGPVPVSDTDKSVSCWNSAHTDDFNQAYLRLSPEQRERFNGRDIKSLMINKPDVSILRNYHNARKAAGNLP